MVGKRHRLVSIRKAAGFSQERLAETVGVERTTIMRWERGETTPQPWARPKLARALGISDQTLSELLGEGAEPESTASASGSIAGELAPQHPPDLSERSVVFPVVGFDELRHLGVACDDARHYLDIEDIPSEWAPVLCEALSRRLGRTVTLDELGRTVQLLFSHVALDRRTDNGAAEHPEGSKSSFLPPKEDAISVEPMPARHARSMEAILMSAADESAEILAWAEATNVGDLTIEQIHAEIYQITHSYLKVPTIPLFDRTRELRNGIVGLLKGRQKPSHSCELYSAAGWVLAMLAWISTDLNVPDAAEKHLRAAWVFAKKADQNDLRCWIRATQHTAAFWQQDFARAAQYAEDGLRYAGSGSTELYLSSACALDLARCGDGERALAVLDRARNAAETASIGEDALSGPFTCSIARAGGFWSDTHLALGNTKEALLYADSAVKGFEATPSDRRNFGSERMARCQQVKAYLLADEFDGASEALMPVLDTTPEHRVRPLLQRVDEIFLMTASYGERNSLKILELQAAINEFRNIQACGPLLS